MKKKVIGYTQGVFDLFHIGHLNLLMNAKSKCDYLIVGINSDSLVTQYKNKKPIIDEKSRIAIVDSIKCVDKTLIVDTLDKVEIRKKVKFDVIFIGDDWKGNARWEKTIEDLSSLDVKVCFLPYTQSVSTSKIKTTIKNET